MFAYGDLEASGGLETALGGLVVSGEIVAGAVSTADALNPTLNKRRKVSKATKIEKKQTNMCKKQQKTRK